MRQMVTRRGFIGAGVALAAAGCASSAAQGAAERDERFSVFLSDTHIPGEGTELDKNHVEHDPAYMYKRLAATVDEVLAMRPMPEASGHVGGHRGRRAGRHLPLPLGRLNGQRWNDVHDAGYAFLTTISFARPSWSCLSRARRSAQGRRRSGNRSLRRYAPANLVW